MIGNANNIWHHAVFGGGATPLLIDLYPQTAAWSVRKLRAAQTQCMRIRRNSDDAELDIGFVAGWVDQAAIIAHCGVAAGFVTTMYDQTTGSCDLLQASSALQPQIYNGTIVLVDAGGNPGLLFAAAEYMRDSTIASSAQPNTIYSHFERSADGFLYDGGGGAAARHALFNSGGLYRLYAGSTTIKGSDDTARHVSRALYSTPTATLWIDGVQSGTTATAGTNPLEGVTMGAQQAGGSKFAGFISELILNNTNDANQVAVEADIMAAYA